MKQTVLNFRARYSIPFDVLYDCIIYFLQLLSENAAQSPADG